MALLIYAAFFTCDQAVRKRKGPWNVTFTTNAQGYAEIVINETGLGVSNVVITFLGEKATNTGAVKFDRPLQPVPFGITKFEDLTYLPGSVAFDFFGHEVELLPRTLYLNKQEHPWVSGKRIELKPEQKLPPGMSVDRRKKRRL